ncbi:MAG: M3 family metallopeptidase, partial [Flavobacteriaceae bacterium]
MKSILSAPFAFSAYQLEDYISEIESGIAINKEEIKAIKENPEAPNFNNTIAALDRSGQHLAKFSSAFFNLNASNTSEKWQEAAQQIAPKLSNFSNDIILDQELFERIQSVYNTEALVGEALMLLEKTFKKFTNNGALLQDDQKEDLRKVDEKLSMLSVKFGSNVLADSNAYELHIQEEGKLEGLPQSAIDAAKLTAEQREKEGFVFTLDYPSYLPFMRFCKDRNLRKELYMAFGQKGFQQNEYNNEKTVKEIVKLRAQRAKILGFETYADFILDERMANTPKTVFDFIDELYKKALPAAERELKELKEFAAAREGIENLKKWDVAYFSEQLKAE